MYEFWVYHKGCKGSLTVYGPSLEFVGEKFPTANIFRASNLSEYLARYEP